MLSVGHEGYVSTAKQILNGAQTIANGIRSMEDVELYGEPDLSVVCFGPSRKSHSPMNIYAISEAMNKKNWNLNLLQNPASIHICVTYTNCKMADQFLEDLRNAIAEVKADPDKFSSGTAAVYGMAASMPDKAPVRQIAAAFLDALYTV
jgi:sphinganine-1-phosphate aldolase